MTDRAEAINGILGRPYEKGGAGPDSFDCYGFTRWIQQEVFGREMPLFQAPSLSGRFATASVIQTHPERRQWQRVPAATDGAIVSMARRECAYHLGTWIADDGGLIVHCMERMGVVVDTIPELIAAGWRSLRFYVPVNA